MGLIRKPANYDEPIKNGLTDPIYEFFGGVDLREKKRRDRREARNKAMSWWYHHTHPWWGLRTVCILAGIALLTIILVQQRVVGAQICLTDVGCVFTQDGALNAAPAESAPRVLEP
ncbi:MAG: hypothetical protein IT200_07970 [Thermoleophilia bacterium]|nr:hypothetical protein [Thermoleophilia bacterium]